MLNQSLILMLLAALASDARPVRTQVYPNVIAIGGDVRVSCIIPPSPANRAVVVGVYDFTSSFVQLEGENAATRTERWFRNPPCGELTVFCELVRVREGKVEHLVERASATKQCLTTED